MKIMVIINVLLLIFLLAPTLSPAKTSSRWSSVIPVNVSNHGNVSIHRRDLRGFRFNNVLSIYKMFSGHDDDSTEEHSVIHPNRLLNENANLDKMSFIKLRRFRRNEERKWMEVFTTASIDVIKMHAFIVKDEEIPDCGTAAQIFTKTRYYVCSGSVLTQRHVLTSATCMNKAVFHDYHIHAEVGALVGDLEENSYVMKALDYTMHPKYDPNPASTVHELNNLAVMSLACPIPDGTVVLPQLPPQKFDDLAHVCCSDKCSILSVSRLAHNRYVLETMMAKHLPTFDKIHGKDFAILGILDTAKDNEGSFDKNSLHIRRIRDNQKTFISKFYVQKVMDQINKNKFQEIEKPTIALDKDVSTHIPAIRREKRDNTLLWRLIRDTPKGNKDSQKITDLSSQWLQVVKEINAGNVSAKSQDEMRTFLKTTMTDLLQKIVKVLSTHVGDAANAYPYFLEAINSDNITKTVEQSLMSYLAKAVHTGDFFKDESTDNGSAQNGSDESDIEQTSPNRTQLVDTALRALDLAVEKKEKVEFFCPSIGTPVILNSTLIGLIVYTCDEIQNWVAWKYVETIRNTEWIRKQLQVISYEKDNE